MLGSIGVPELIIICFFFAVPLVLLIFYILELKRALSKCAPENRTIDRHLVWLLIIPVFNILWHFIIVQNIACSLRNEFQKRNITSEKKPGHLIGIWLSIFFGLANIHMVIFLLIPTNYQPYLTLLAYFIELLWVILWVIYWVKINTFSKLLSS
jgi:hypothetical protein